MGDGVMKLTQELHALNRDITARVEETKRAVEAEENDLQEALMM